MASHALQGFRKRTPTTAYMLTYPRRYFWWSFTLVCFIIVCGGWNAAIEKYRSGRTFVTMVVNETESFTYPSITFCKRFKNLRLNSTKYSYSLVDFLTAESESTGQTVVDHQMLHRILANVSYQRQDFFTFFTHDNPQEARDNKVDLLREDSVWEQSIPHSRESGLCHTYNPSFKSPSLPGYGMRFGISFPDSGGWSQRKDEELLQLRIFIHEKDQFIFFTQDPRPSAHLVDVSWFRPNQETLLYLSFSHLSKLSDRHSPCSVEEDYNFNLCMERFFAEKRGCQAPWNVMPEFSDIPACRDVEVIRNKFREDRAGTVAEIDWNKPFWSTHSLSYATECLVPCASKQYSMKVSYKTMKPANTSKDFPRSDWVVSLQFKNFKFEYKKEDIACNWQCLMKEMTGFWGFFLGVSIVFVVDKVTNQVLGKG